MKILAIEHEIPGSTAANFAPFLGDEARQVWDLYQAGVIREVYFRQEQAAAVLVLECPDVTEAEKTLACLPLAAAGLIRFELIALRAYPGFERLFDNKKE